MKIIEKSLEVEINKLENWKHNARAIQKADFERLKSQITELGIYKPMVCYEHDGKYIVLGGNMRLRAIKEIGHTTGWITVVEPKDDEEKLRINLSDNDRAGFYQDEEFAKVIFDFKDSDWADYKIDFVEPQGNVDEFNKEYFEEENQGNTDDDDVPPVPIEPKTKTGELWILGEHRLLIGDATKEADVGRLMGAEKAIATISDPPYNIDYGNIKHPKFKERDIQNDNMSADEYLIFCGKFADNIAVFNLGCIYIWGAPAQDGRIMFTQLDKRFHCSTTVIWNKDQFTLGRGKYQNKYEPCWFGWVEDGTRFSKERTLVNVWDFKRPQKSDIHPTMKPVALMQKCITDSTLKTDIVLDFFLGSGSTLIACEKTNRCCYGMEIAPIYGDVTLTRWADFTGKDPFRDGDNMLWSQLNADQENVGSRSES